MYNICYLANVNRKDWKELRKGKARQIIWKMEVRERKTIIKIIGRDRKDKAIKQKDLGRLSWKAR